MSGTDGSVEVDGARWASRGRTAAAVVVAVAIIALAAMALTTGTDGFAISSPALPSAATHTAVPPTVPAPEPTTRVGAAAAVAPAREPAIASPAPAVTATAPAAVSDTSSPPAPASAPAAAPCPFPLPAAEHEAGLGDLIGLVPAFGPFSAEAFAIAPVLQPVLRLFGPFVPAFAATLDAADPASGAVLDAIRALAEAGYGVLEPVYGPHRAAFVAAEAQLAAALAPYAQQLAGSAIASCIVDLEATLVPTGPVQS